MTAALKRRFGQAARPKAMTLGEAQHLLMEQEGADDRSREQDETDVAQAFSQRAYEERTTAAHVKATKAHEHAANTWTGFPDPHSRKMGEAHTLKAKWHRDQKSTR